MTSVCENSICICQDCRNKGFMFTIEEVWDPECSPENQFFNINSCKWPSTSSLKVSLGSDELLMSYYLFIVSSHQHVQHMTSQILLILIDFDSFFGHFKFIYFVDTMLPFGERSPEIFKRLTQAVRQIISKKALRLLQYSLMIFYHW